jgi:hypothetical protein
MGMWYVTMGNLCAVGWPEVGTLPIREYRQGGRGRCEPLGVLSDPEWYGLLESHVTWSLDDLK